MAGVALSDLKSVRGTLKMSQRDMARLLNVSLRAVQSYEQGWRPTPMYIQQLSGMLLYMNWRKSGGRPTSCWSVRKCKRSQRAACAVHRLGAGDVCWLIGGKNARVAGETPEQRLARCTKCPVMLAWLPDAPAKAEKG